LTNGLLNIKSATDVTTLFLSFLYRMKDEGDITTCKIEKDFNWKELSRSSSDLS